MMRGYAEAHDCRREYILNYFGEQYESKNCQMCDVSIPRKGEIRHVITEEKTTKRKFVAGSTVAHKEFGKGIVIRQEEDTVTVLFDQAGYQTLLYSVLEKG